MSGRRATPTIENSPRLPNCVFEDDASLPVHFRCNELPRTAG